MKLHWSNILHLMSQDKVDYTLFFRRLCHLSSTNDANLTELFTQKDQWLNWKNDYFQRISLDNRTDKDRQISMKKINPKFILRNYLLQQAIEKAERQDFTEIDILMSIIKSPLDKHSAYEQYADAPPKWGKHLLISCSS